MNNNLSTCGVDIITDVDIIFCVDIVEQFARKTVDSIDEKWQLAFFKNALSWNFELSWKLCLGK